MDRRLSATTIVRLSADHERRQDRQKTERHRQLDIGICTVALGTCQGQGHILQGQGHVDYGL